MSVDLGSPLIGRPTPADPIMLMQQGRQRLFPQVCVTAIADPVVAQMAAYIARITVIEILGSLEDAGVVPAGTRQKYENPVQLEANPTVESNSQSTD